MLREMVGQGGCMQAARIHFQGERENPVFLCCPPSCPQVLCVGDGSKKVSEDGEFGMWKVDVTQGEQTKHEKTDGKNLM